MGDLPTLPAEAMEIVTRSRITRARATRKLREVLKLAASGAGETASIRTVSVLGSFARGALSVGDIDLVIEVDDPRDERTAHFNDFYARMRGRNPDGPLLRDLRCSGTSMVSAIVVRKFGEQQELDPPQPPQLAHIVTKQPLSGPSRLLFVRGDSVTKALDRLEAIEEDPSAARFDRTTGVPLLDELIDHVGVTVQYKLAELVLGGGLELSPVVLAPGAEVPVPVVEFEAEQGLIPGGKNRRQAILAATSHLLDSGVQAHQISLRGTRLLDDPTEESVLLDWGTMTLFSISTELLHNDWKRVLIILRSTRKGPWIALDCSTRDRAKLEEIDAAASRREAKRLSESFEIEVGDRT